jgi:ligand-binding sensor domain-containing protein/signal transduction histidine kinase
MGIVIFLTVLQQAFGFSQVSTGELKFTHLSVEDGLSQSTVWTILQDSNGFLWFGTADGLDKYDGYSFKAFQHTDGDSTSIVDNFLNCLAEDKQGRLWIGTDAGLCFYDRQTNTFKNVSDSVEHEFTLSHRKILRLLVDRSGTLWVGTVSGCVVIDPVTQRSKTTQYNLSHNVLHSRAHAIAEDSNGDVWISAGDSLVRYEQASQRTRYVPVPVTHSTIASIFQDRAGVMWFGTVNSALLSCDAATSRWDIFEYKPKGYQPISENFLSSIIEDKSGRLWVGTRLGGLSIFDRATHTWQRFVPKLQGQRFEGVNTLCLDKSGLLWAGFDGAGAVKVNTAPMKFHHILLPSTAGNITGENFLKPVMVDRFGELWIGRFDKGLAVLDRSTGVLRRYVHVASDPSSLSSNAIIALLEDRDGRLWVGTEEGVNLYNRTTNRFRRYATGNRSEDSIAKTGGARMPRGSEVRTLCQDSSGTIFAGTARKLFRFDEQSQQFVEVKIRETASGKYFQAWVESIACSHDGTLWLGTDLNGLYHIDLHGNVLEHYSHDASKTLCHNTVKCIHIQENGTLWIGTVEGLSRYDPAKNLWLQYHEKDGLPDGTIYGILTAGTHTMWLSTNRGLSRMDIADPDHPSFRNYTPDDGLQSYEFNTNTYFKTRAGEMLFGGINGLNTFYPDSITDNPNIPQVVLTGFKKYDQTFSTGCAPELMDSIALDYSETVFSFDYAALEFTSPSRNRYAYMLEGFEKQWVYCGSRREARYTNLSPGTYTFKVKGTNDDGVWNEAGLAVKVTIVPPFWQRIWFLLCAVVTLAGVVGGSMRYIFARNLRREIDKLERERALDRERQQTRDRIARDLHDEVSSTLSSMSLFVESSKHRLHTGEKGAEQILDKLHVLARDAEDAMEQAVWSLSSHHDRLSDLIARIRDVASEVCNDNDIRSEVYVTLSVEDFLLREAVRKNVYLTFKEALANAVKHARAHSLVVTIGTEGEEFHLSIKDDGKGLPAAPPHPKSRGGNGLKNMNSRAAEIGATLNVESRPGEGVTVTLVMQIAHMRH